MHLWNRFSGYCPLQCLVLHHRAGLEHTSIIPFEGQHHSFHMPSQCILFQQAMGIRSTGPSCWQRKSFKMLPRWAPPPQHKLLCSGAFPGSGCQWLAQGPHCPAGCRQPRQPQPPARLCHKRASSTGQNWYPAHQLLQVFPLSMGAVTCQLPTRRILHLRARRAFVAFRYLPDVCKELFFLLLDLVTVVSSTPASISHTSCPPRSTQCGSCFARAMG